MNAHQFARESSAVCTALCDPIFERWLLATKHKTGKFPSMKEQEAYYAKLIDSALALSPIEQKEQPK